MKSASGAATIVNLGRRGDRRPQHELEFLPAALEIVDTPVSPASRVLASGIALFAIVAVAWACVAQIDIISTATGKIVPTGRVKTIQPFETGVVRAIHVHDGDTVKAGEVLVELDPTINAAEVGRISDELLTHELDIRRLRALLADPDDPNGTFVSPPNASARQIELQKTLLVDQRQEIDSKLGNLDRQIAQSTASLAEAQAQLQKLTLEMPLLEERVQISKKVSDGGWGPRPHYLELAQDLVDHQGDLHVENAKVVETTAAIAALQEQKSEAEAEFRRTNLADLEDAEQKAQSAREQLVQAQQRQRLQTLTAPVDGTIQQTAIHTIGGVVTPAQPLMVIVPADSKLEIDAMVSNNDIGFVREGEKADIKVDTFNFTKYGLLHGEVLNVSHDAVTRDIPSPDQQRTTMQHRSSNNANSKAQEPVYDARVSLDQTQMRIDGKQVNLTPGMAVTVEIKTGKRRVIEYLLSPLLRYKQESLRER